MNELDIFINRLRRIGVETTFSANYPWIYLDTVCGVKVKGNFRANHGFTAFFNSLIANGPKPYNITDIGIIFKKIRKTLKLAGKEQSFRQNIRKEFAEELKAKIEIKCKLNPKTEAHIIKLGFSRAPISFGDITNIINDILEEKHDRL